ncbi:hypothetical protein [Dactylosporangium sp. NPDC000521]|uniref:hypothetical protein n=1 Tax=Dactylosporangium sp. NPDC000521 TaxID=3363975 RepID=UPI0036B40624
MRFERRMVPVGAAAVVRRWWPALAVVCRWAVPMVVGRRLVWVVVGFERRMVQVGGCGGAAAVVRRWWLVLAVVGRWTVPVAASRQQLCAVVGRWPVPMVVGRRLVWVVVGFERRMAQVGGCGGAAAGVRDG